MTNMTDDWNPGPKYRFYLSKIREILGTERRTVRDIYYALEARGFPEECEKRGYDFDYRAVKRAVKLGRRHGYIDPDLIIDTSRPTTVSPTESHADPEDFLRSNVRHIEHGYFLNHWEDQPKHVEVWLEKASLASVFRPICDGYNIRLEATRGDWSDSKVYEATERLRDKILGGKEVRILYFGDFNPSGLHAPVSVQETMGYYGLPLPWGGEDSSEPRYFDIWPWEGPFSWGNADGDLHFERVSLTLEEIERFDLPENPTPSSSDKDRTLRERFMQFASDGRDVNIELNALKEFEREYLEDRLQEAIDKHVDDDVEQEVADRQAYIHEQLQQSLDVDYSVVEDL